MVSSERGLYVQLLKRSNTTTKRKRTNRNIARKMSVSGDHVEREGSELEICNLQQSLSCGRASGNIDIDRYDAVTPSNN